VSLIHLVPSSYIVSLQNCMNEEYWRLAGTRFARLAGGENGIQFAFRYNHRLLPADEAQLGGCAAMVRVEGCPVNSRVRCAARESGARQ
jgi:hypothetical protein